MENFKFDFNTQFADAYDLLENTNSHVFITGQAGTGKSTLLQYFREHTSKDVVVLAPTGVAAVNVKGQTIHSFFRFKPNITPEGVCKIRIRKEDKEIYKNIDTLIIDEVSMVRADLLDCVDTFLRLYGRKRKKAFGGLQIIFVGDLYQLPPVVTKTERDIFKEVYASPFFFSAKVFSEISPEFIDLEKIYRQTDDEFIDLLSSIRDKSVTIDHMKLLSQRVDPFFKSSDDDFYVYLTTTNAVADRINQEQLLKTKSKSFYFEGVVDGKFESKNLPTHKDLELKIGAQVMLLNNDPGGRWINGSIGKVVDITDDLTETNIIGVELENGAFVEVASFKWEMFKFFYNEETKSIESELAGSFLQYPLKLAWAVTIHKSQGKTFAKVIVDIGQGTFAHGQAYVALSRCTTLEGLVLKKPILQRHMLLDSRVVDFMKKFQREDEVMSEKIYSDLGYEDFS